MPHFTDLTGLAGAASAITAALLLIPGIALLPQRYLAAALAAVFALALIPFGDLPIAAYLRGATGDLSITTLVLLWSALLSRLRTANPDAVRKARVNSDERAALPGLVALTAVMFYPLALGIGMFDPYRMGYGDALFIGALLLLALLAWLRNFLQIVLCIALAALAWAIGWYESTNLWDYLLDPFVSIYALWISVAVMWKMRSKPASGQTPEK